MATKIRVYLLERKNDAGKFDETSEARYIKAMTIDHGVEIGTAKIKKVPHKTCIVAGYCGVFVILSRSLPFEELEKSLGGWYTASSKIIERYHALQLV